VQETIQTCRSARKPYAVVINGAPAQRDGIESRSSPIARETLTNSARRSGRPDHQPRRSVDGAQSRRRRREYYAEGRAAAEIPGCGPRRTSVKAIRGSDRLEVRCHRQAA